MQPGIVVCDLGTMPPVRRRRCLITVLVAPSVPNGTHLINSVDGVVGDARSEPGEQHGDDSTRPSTRKRSCGSTRPGSCDLGIPRPIVTYTLVRAQQRRCETDAQSTVSPNCGCRRSVRRSNIVVTDKLPLDYKKVTVQFLSPQCTWTKATNTRRVHRGRHSGGCNATSSGSRPKCRAASVRSRTPATVTSSTADPVTRQQHERACSGDEGRDRQGQVALFDGERPSTRGLSPGFTTCRCSRPDALLPRPRTRRRSRRSSR